MTSRGLSKDVSKMGFMNRAKIAINPILEQNKIISSRSTSNTLLSFPIITNLTQSHSLTSPLTGRNTFGQIDPPPEEELEEEEDSKPIKKRKSDTVDQVRRPAKKPTTFQKPIGFDDVKPKTGGNSATIITRPDKSRNRRQEKANAGPPSAMMKNRKGKEIETEPVWDQQGVERAWDAGKEFDSQEEEEGEEEESEEEESDEEDILNLLTGAGKTVKLEDEIDEEMMIQEMDFDAGEQSRKSRKGRRN